MSLIDKKNKKELQDIARSLFIEVDESAGVKELRAALHEENVSDEDIEGLEIVPEVDPNAPIVSEADGGIVTLNSLQSEVVEAPVVIVKETVAESPQSTHTLIKYERQNPTFEILNYRFSKEHPFQLVLLADADYIVRSVPGFRPALASEAEEFYN